MAKEKIKVDGMSCNHCKLAVENTLKKVKGVSEATVNLDEGSVEVDFDDSLASKTQLINAINETETYTANA